MRFSHCVSVCVCLFVWLCVCQCKCLCVCTTDWLVSILRRPSNRETGGKVQDYKYGRRRRMEEEEEREWEPDPEQERELGPISIKCVNRPRPQPQRALYLNECLTSARLPASQFKLAVLSFDEHASKSRERERERPTKKSTCYFKLLSYSVLYSRICFVHICFHFFLILIPYFFLSVSFLSTSRLLCICYLTQTHSILAVWAAFWRQRDQIELADCQFVHSFIDSFILWEISQTGDTIFYHHRHHHNFHIF